MHNSSHGSPTDWSVTPPIAQHENSSDDDGHNQLIDHSTITGVLVPPSNADPLLIGKSTEYNVAGCCSPTAPGLLLRVMLPPVVREHDGER